VGVLVCRRELKQTAAALWAKNEKFSNAAVAVLKKSCLSKLKKPIIAKHSRKRE
jgi:hypothetical protein